MHGRNLSEHALVHKVHYLYVTRVEQTLLPCKEDTFGGQVLVVHVEALLHIIAYILELLALVFAACCFTCMQFYSAMAIGYSFSNHKLLLSVVFFFAINVALSILQPLLLVFTGNAGLLDFMANSAQNISGPAAVHLVLLGAFLYALVFFAVLYIPTRLLLKRRLNLP